MLTLPDILLGLILPSLICAAILLAAWRPWKGEDAPDGRWAGGLAIGAGYAAAYARLVGNLAFPPADADNWIVYFMAIAAGLGAAFCMLIPRSAWPKIIAVLVASAALVWLLIKPFMGTSIATATAAAWIVVFALAMTLWWIFVNQSARRGPRVLVSLALMIATAAGAVVLGEGGMAIRGGFPLGAMTVILGAVTVIAAFTRRFTLAGGGILAVMLVLIGTMAYADFNIFPEPPTKVVSAMMLVLISPLLLWVSRLPGLRRRPIWLQCLIGLIAVLMAAGLAVALAATGSAGN